MRWNPSFHILIIHTTLSITHSFFVFIYGDISARMNHYLWKCRFWNSHIPLSTLILSLRIRILIQIIIASSSVVFKNKQNVNNYSQLLFFGKKLLFFQKGAHACALKSIKTTNVHYCILQIFALFTLISNNQSYMHTLLCYDIFQVSSRKIWIYIISQWFDPFFFKLQSCYILKEEIPGL